MSDFDDKNISKNRGMVILLENIYNNEVYYVL